MLTIIKLGLVIAAIIIIIGTSFNPAPLALWIATLCLLIVIGITQFQLKCLIK